jgi:hypothetical protein
VEQPPARTVLAWALWLATVGCCAAGLGVALLVARPLSAGLLASGAGSALAIPLGYATVGLVLTLRRPANPIGWLYAASALTWSLIIPLGPSGPRPSPSASPCRPCCCRTGGCARPAGGWSWARLWPARSCSWSAPC